MKAVVYAGYGADPVLTQVADPDCPADGVVVAVGEVIALGDVGRVQAAMDGPAGAGMTVVRLAG